MIAFPNCKINLGLNVIRKREDNYHDIETVFYPVEFKDVLEIISNGSTENTFTVTGLSIGNTNDNLCIKAYNALKRDYRQLPFIQLHLHKAIPTGAGLGGGSADAAFTLTLLNEKFSLQLTNAQLNNYALQLGSDCPFFLFNKPCFATGRGEILEAINIDLSQYKIVLVNPGIKINTAWAFGKIKPLIPGISIRNIIVQPVNTWKDTLVNDFEMPVFEDYPEIKKIQETLYNMGAVYASLSGSGSTVYGIFNKNAFLQPEFPDSYFSHVVNVK